jgi:hypothetical protein
MKSTVSTSGDTLFVEGCSGSQISAKLIRLHELPEPALLTADEAALYLNARRDLLRSWRWQGKGPVFVGCGHFVRYRKRDLDIFLSGHERTQLA